LLAGYLHSADPWSGFTARLESAVILRCLGRIDEASLGCDAALAAFPDTGEIWGIGIALMLRAELDKIAGNFRGAIAALERGGGLGLLGSVPDRDIPWLHSDLTRLRVRTGDYAAAHVVLDLADQNARERGDPGRYLRLTASPRNLSRARPNSNAPKPSARAAARTAALSVHISQE
jgi:hypothetical protein